MSARCTTDVRETFAKELAVRRIVQPSRGTARMRQRDIRDAIPHTRTADGALQRDLSPETIDGETAEEKDHARSEDPELFIEPRCAERHLGRRRPAIAVSGRPSRKALRDRGAIR